MTKPKITDFIDIAYSTTEGVSYNYEKYCRALLIYLDYLENNDLIKNNTMKQSTPDVEHIHCKLEVEPEHFKIATQFAEEMIGRFDPHQLHEMLQHIKHKFDENLQLQIEKSKKHLEYLTEILNYL